MTASSKSYKASLNKAFNKYQKDMQNKVRNLKSTDPKVYWQIINKSADDHTRQEVKKISMQIFVEHFKKPNTNDSKRDEGDVTDNTNIDNLNVELNKPFEPDEVKKSIKKLKKNKACGNDQVLNKFLKWSCDSMINVFTKLFNLVLQTGIVPEEWCISNIIPLYKNKGDICNPDNYRGISIVSCSGKLFTSVLNQRSGIFIDGYGLIGSEQGGFRKGRSTIDHVFVLKTLIDLYLNKRKRIYCCFIDYKKAFDNVSRVSLWTKMLSLNINGQILNVIKNLYSNAKCYIKMNGKLSNVFKSAFAILDLFIRSGKFP